MAWGLVLLATVQSLPQPSTSPSLGPGQGEVGTTCHQLSCRKWVLIALLLYLHALQTETFFLTPFWCLFVYLLFETGFY